jgi:hypothetical protein
MHVVEPRDDWRQSSSLQPASIETAIPITAMRRMGQAESARRSLVAFIGAALCNRRAGP